MPSAYAHYRFGMQLLPELPESARQVIRQSPRLFEVGLHGPDVFFYYNPLRRTALGELGSSLHEQSGQEFFQRACAGARQSGRRGLACLFGILAHYCLDRQCHPTILKMADEQPATHTQLEVELDRALLELDGRIPPHTQSISAHLRLSADECRVAARCYAVKARQFRTALSNMALCNRILSYPEGFRRNLVKKALSIAGGESPGMLMPSRRPDWCERTVAPLLTLYDRALALYPRLLEQLCIHYQEGTPLGSDFLPSFT